MILFGESFRDPSRGWTVLALYWGTVTLLACAALYLAFVDLRFIRLQYKLAERALVRESFGAPHTDRGGEQNAPERASKDDG